ncbi:protein javelin-like [Neocloeon triangulifer]|uniref:protein javelin-like n=1 Tax=Neocloeon triangulifer TaxID=2078957 RepID=UPI00286F4D45|nr:protein javelin-like [Neocloeon triangulifer]
MLAGSKSMRPSVVKVLRKDSRPEQTDGRFFCPQNPSNREVLDSELPSPDTVRRALSFFELKAVPPRQPRQIIVGGDERSVQSDTSDEDCESEEESKAVSRQTMERIRAQGCSVTYFGGRVVASNQKHSPTRRVLQEILQTRQRSLVQLSAAKSRLVKSNSCDSRLEILVFDNEIL